MKFFETCIDVRFDESDEMGIVHHKNYFSWFEVARFKLLEAVGLDYNQIKEKKLGFIVINASCEYLSPAKFGNSLIIQTYLTIEKKTKLSFFYFIRRKIDYELIAKGKTIHVLVKEGKITLDIPQEIKEKIFSFIKEHKWDSKNNLKIGNDKSFMKDYESKI